MHAKSTPHPTAAVPGYTGSPPTEPCPECGRTDFAGNAERARHRRAKHGVPGASPTAKARERQKKAKQYNLIDPHDASASPDFAIGYAVATIASVIGTYSRQVGCPPAVFAEKVFAILRQRMQS
jgi:hypothetical protein